MTAEDAPKPVPPIIGAPEDVAASGQESAEQVVGPTLGNPRSLGALAAAGATSEQAPAEVASAPMESRGNDALTGTLPIGDQTPPEKPYTDPVYDKAAPLGRERFAGRPVQLDPAPFTPPVIEPEAKVGKEISEPVNPSSDANVGLIGPGTGKPLTKGWRERYDETQKPQQQ
ncbi:MAG TPA: hypothetical protein VLE73_01100 [Candidatus Saccharimonadales bacterium]|nr:hypothetical protein [Candidatus Saccharimonadales bacterium]